MGVLQVLGLSMPKPAKYWKNHPTAGQGVHEVTQEKLARAREASPDGAANSFILFVQVATLDVS